MVGRRWWGDGAGTGLIGNGESSRELRLDPNINPKVAGAGTGEDEGKKDPPLSSIRSH